MGTLHSPSERDRATSHISRVTSARGARARVVGFGRCHRGATATAGGRRGRKATTEARPMMEAPVNPRPSRLTLHRSGTRGSPRSPRRRTPASTAGARAA